MREKLAELADSSVDSIVTDPPYHLTTGKKGGSGPASVNLESPYGRARIGTGFMGMKWDGGDVAMQAATWALLLRVAKPGSHLLAFGGSRTFHRVWCAVEDAGWEIRDTVLWLHGEGFPKSSNQDGDWQGWGTALKPAFEPVLLARKPLIGTVAENLQAHRVGALNIDACRVPTNGESLDGGRISSKNTGWDRPWKHDDEAVARAHERGAEAVEKAETLGRWPANVLHDGSDEVVEAFPDGCGQTGPEIRHRNTPKTKAIFGAFGEPSRDGIPHDAPGSAARFFWCPKASPQDRDDGLQGEKNLHPTVKPTELMQYLIRLVTPKEGVVLDPFMGSGSTGKACMREGMNFVGIEIDPAYIEIARRRIIGVAPLFAEVQ